MTDENNNRLRETHAGLSHEPHPPQRDQVARGKLAGSADAAIPDLLAESVAAQAANAAGATLSADTAEPWASEGATPTDAFALTAAQTAAEQEQAGDDVDDEPDGPAVVQIRKGVFWASVAAALLLIAALAGAAGYFAQQANGSENPVVARVNGEEIRRDEYDEAVARGNGADILDGLVLERLVNIEAKKRGITIGEGEQADLLSKQKQEIGGDAEFQSALAQSGLTEAEFGKRLALVETLRRMVQDKVTEPSDEELRSAYEAQQSQLNGQTLEQARTGLVEQLRQRKENEEMRILLTDLRANAKIETMLPGSSDS